MLKLNLGCSGMVMGKLNQWKICVSHYVLSVVLQAEHDFANSLNEQSKITYLLSPKISVLPVIDLV